MLKPLLPLMLLCSLLCPAGAAETAPASPSVTAERLLDDIAPWLAASFGLPGAHDRPAVTFATDHELAMRFRDLQALSRPDASHDDGPGEAGAPNQIEALYDHHRHVIILSDRWTGITPADQSVLVHEMVHHLQTAARLSFECPMARERLAWKAQDAWLRRLGTDLEREFQIDPFTVLITSSCM